MVPLAWLPEHVPLISITAPAWVLVAANPDSDADPWIFHTPQVPLNLKSLPSRQVLSGQLQFRALFVGIAYIIKIGARTPFEKSDAAGAARVLRAGSRCADNAGQISGIGHRQYARGSEADAADTLPDGLATLRAAVFRVEPESGNRATVTESENATGPQRNAVIDSLIFPEDGIATIRSIVPAAGCSGLEVTCTARQHALFHFVRYYLETEIAALGLVDFDNGNASGSDYLFQQVTAEIACPVLPLLGCLDPEIHLVRESGHSGEQAKERQWPLS